MRLGLLPRSRLCENRATEKEEYLIDDDRNYEKSLESKVRKQSKVESIQFWGGLQ